MNPKNSPPPGNLVPVPSSIRRADTREGWFRWQEKAAEIPGPGTSEGSGLTGVPGERGFPLASLKTMLLGLFCRIYLAPLGPQQPTQAA